jgi:hypothetical protein
MRSTIFAPSDRGLLSALKKSFIHLEQRLSASSRRIQTWLASPITHLRSSNREEMIKDQATTQTEVFRLVLIVSQIAAQVVIARGLQNLPDLNTSHLLRCAQVCVDRVASQCKLQLSLESKRKEFEFIL